MAGSASDDNIQMLGFAPAWDQHGSDEVDILIEVEWFFSPKG